MTYKIPVIWQSWGIVEVEADSEIGAINAAMDSSCPSNGEYIEDSFEVDYDGIPLHNPHIQNTLKSCEKA